MIIYSKTVNKISGPISINILKPSKGTFEMFKENGGRAPYVIIFGDQHFTREDDCKDCKCEDNWGFEDNEENCCLPIDSIQLLREFDAASNSEFPIDFYVEQVHEPNIGDIDIEDKNVYIKSRDTTGYMAKFLHDYNICYSKSKRGTREYDKCPTKNIRWHFTDTRFIINKNVDDIKLLRGIEVFFHDIIKPFFSIESLSISSTKDKCDDIVKHNRKELMMAFSLFFSGPDFVKHNMSEDSNFLFIKQIKKQTLPALRDINWWHSLVIEKNKKAFKNYKDLTWMTDEIYYKVVAYYVDVFKLILNKEITPSNFEIRRLDLINSMKEWGADITKVGGFISVIDIYSFNFGALLVDFYILSRMFKKPNDGNPSYLSMIYIGDAHAKNIKETLIENFNYELVGEGRNEGKRCINVDNINFNLLKAKLEYILND